MVGLVVRDAAVIVRTGISMSNGDSAASCRHASEHVEAVRMASIPDQVEK